MADTATKAPQPSPPRRSKTPRKIDAPNSGETGKSRECYAPKKKVKFNIVDKDEFEKEEKKEYSKTVPLAHEASKRHPSKQQHGPEYYISEQVHSFLKALCRDEQENEEPVNVVMYKYENGSFTSPNGYFYDKRKIKGEKLQRGWFAAVVVVPFDPCTEFKYQDSKSDVPYLEDCVQEVCAVTGVDCVLITNYNRALFARFEGIESSIANKNLNLFKHPKRVKFAKDVANANTNTSSGGSSDENDDKENRYNANKGHQSLAEKDGYRPVIQVVKCSIEDSNLPAKMWRVVAAAHRRKVRKQVPRVFKK